MSWPGVKRYRFHQSVRSDRNSSDPSGSHRGSSTDSPAPPATTVSSPEARSRTTSSVSSHGIDGWSHCTQASAAPSGDSRGAATKSGPLTRTSGSERRSEESRTTSLRTSTADDPVCRSRTQTIVALSGATSPSA
jgi:hypothetical protein